MTSLSEAVKRPDSRPGRRLIGGAPEGLDALIVAERAAEAGDVVFVARDDARMARAADALAFFAPALERLEFPAWDCLPYDRVSPRAELVSRRIDTLTRLLEPPAEKATARVILTTVSALLQRVPARQSFAGVITALGPGLAMDPDALIGILDHHGYVRADTVMEPGEYARRGGIVDVFPAGAGAPVRLDFFGDQLESLRQIDAASQRSTGACDSIQLKPVSEVPLTEESISRFRSAYRVQFGRAGDDDPLYGAVSDGYRHMGLEHWLPLFHESLETLFDYVSGAAMILDHQADEARDGRLALIAEYHGARVEFAAARKGAGASMAQGGVYRPVPPESLFLDAGEWDRLLAGHAVDQLTPFTPPNGAGIDAGGRPGHDFADVRVRPDANVFDAVRDHIAAERGAGRHVIVTGFSDGSLERLRGVLDEHGVDGLSAVADWPDAAARPASAVSMAVVGLERGFTSNELTVLTESDILGQRMSRPRRPRVRPENFIAEASALNEGDLVVHIDHGIGRFDGLETIEVGGAPHDCLRLVYHGGDKLFLPVENIEVVSRFGSEEAEAQLDRLGGSGWQARKARMKGRVREMAGELIRVAAARALRVGARIQPPDSAYDEFSARFPFAETDDQAQAIEDVMGDLGHDRPMDRLICGDVGFGKTEVALRAAFAAALESKQTAVVVPTTLLCRQHFLTFQERFQGFPIRVAQISRLVTATNARKVKDGLADGTIDIVIGTHALLTADIRFRNLGLLVIDEEQHFGVAHKERLKALRADVHVLTLTATPIPRTLQLALTGLKEMSLIATPPVDRLAVRTFVLPYDPVVVREAVLREKFRGGQTFYVCPRVADLDRVAKRLAELVPEVKLGTAHGRMRPAELEDVMTRFYDGAFDVLVSTNIIESGLDLPAVNTIIIHRADMFGLSQLYQLRGRVGRSKVRAYAYLTLPPGQVLTAAADKRLEVMQTLDTLGAGFSLASHDLDIRGAGNLLGAEQSGHIREVGIELYQQMLEEAVAEARGLDGAGTADDDWSPVIAVGMPVLIPDSYVADLTVRMGLYRRLAWLTETDEIDAFATEMIDRFGTLPEEAENLLRVVALKQLCRRAGIAKVDAGPKGALASFRKESFANPAGLVQWITEQRDTAKLRPDHTLVFMRAWEDADERLTGVTYLLRELAAIAEAASS